MYQVLAMFRSIPQNFMKITWMVPAVSLVKIIVLKQMGWYFTLFFLRQFISWLYCSNKTLSGYPSKQKPIKRCRGQESRLLHQMSQVRIPGKAWVSYCPSMALPVAEQFCAENWQSGSARFILRSRLSTQPFGVFRGFLRNTRKYGLGFIRKTPTEGTAPFGLDPS